MAVDAQAARLIAAAGGPGHLPEAFMLIVALRNVRRAARMAHSHMRIPQAMEQLAEALAEFDLALPGITDARNVVEHFDEYSVGTGQLQRAQLRDEPSLTAGELADSFAVRFGWDDSDERRPQLRIGQHVIEIGQAGDAASLLVDEIWAALRTEEGTLTRRSAARAIHQTQKNEGLRRRPNVPSHDDGAEYLQ